jgi:glycosyltransferase involved in cell wall biosynthesis
LHVYQDFYPKRGGIEDHILTLARGPSDHYRHAVLVAASGPITRCDEAGDVPVVRAAAWGRYYTPVCPTMSQWIGRLAPDIVHVHHPSPMAFAACLLARPRVPLVVGYHNDVVRPHALIRFYAPIQDAVLRRADAILVGTQAYLDTSPFLEPYRAKCRIVPYGIPLEQFAVDSEAEARADQLRVRYRGPLVLFVGRLTYYKGLSVALEAMRRVKATLLIAGAGVLETDLRRQIRELHLEERVIMLGPVDDAVLNACYLACDVCILPSTHRSEAFGLVMLQAQACGRPVVCSNLPGLSTVNVPGETGLVVPPGDPEALAEGITRLLDDPELRGRMGRTGRGRVERLFTAEAMSRRVEEVYGALAA